MCTFSEYNTAVKNNKHELIQRLTEFVGGLHESPAVARFALKR